MKRILVLFYSQSGQLAEVARSVLEPLQNSGDLTVAVEELRPAVPFPFPWKLRQFFDVFPESVEEIPCALQPFHFDPEAEFDLVILFFQVWFLSPSVPITAFLQSAAARKVLAGRP